MRLHRSLAALLAIVPTALAATSLASAQTEPPPAAKEGEKGQEKAPAAPPPAATGDKEKDDRPDLIPKEVDPKKDAASLEKMGEANPATVKPDASAKGTSTQIFSDDWWRYTRPIVELHGFFRTRAELFHNFSLGRIDGALDSGSRLFPRPADDSWSDTRGNEWKTGGVRGCGPTSDPANPNDPSAVCSNKTNASANLRFRVDPEIHISDNLRIMSQVDLLDNVVMGSTPEGWVNTPGKSSSGSSGSTSASTGYSNPGRGGYVPLLAFSSTQVPPVAGINSYQNSIAVKRVWGEFLTPVGQLRFGRMPSHWGLGILANGGDKIDSDYQSTADRLMFATGSKNLDLYVAGAWDFPNTGKTSATVKDQQGQPYNVAQLDNTSQWVLVLFRKVKAETAAQKLARGDVVVNGGVYAVYRQQILANESSSATNTLDASPKDYAKDLTRLGAKAWIFDPWLQVLTKRLRWETEAVYIYGSIENPRGVSSGSYNREDYKIRQFGVATEFEYKALNDDLRLRFNSGFASGDQGVEGLAPGDGLQPRPTSDKTISTFRFHPDYRVDLILFRNILTRVQGVYYFKPGIEYDFTRSLDGERLGGRAEIIWSRASKFVQAPGHKEDLGVELDLSLYYQSRDGSLNDDPSKIGGFYAMLQYGVLFPLGGLGYMSNQTVNGVVPEVSSAQIVRLFLGIAY